jgi:DNA-binding transcriptional LysR family regulator
METTYLREFVTLTETFNYAAAARQLYISPSSLIRHIGSLEAELGVQLLTRGGGGLSLTDAGLALRNEADNLLEELDSSLLRVRSTAFGRRRLRFGMLRLGIGLKRAFPLIHRFRQKHPDSELLTIPLQPKGIFIKLSDQSIDVGLSVYSKHRAHPGLALRQLATEPLYAIMTHEHPLANETAVTPEQLARETVVMIQGEQEHEQHLRIIFGHHGLSLDRITYTDHADLLSLTLRDANAVTIGIDKLAGVTQEPLRYLPIDSPDFICDIGLLSHQANNSVVLQQFLDCANHAHDL